MRKSSISGRQNTTFKGARLAPICKQSRNLISLSRDREPLYFFALRVVLGALLGTTSAQSSFGGYSLHGLWQACHDFNLRQRSAINAECHNPPERRIDSIEELAACRER